MVLCRILTLFMTRILFLCYRRIDLVVDRYTSRTGKCFIKYHLYIIYVFLAGKIPTHLQIKYYPLKLKSFRRNSIRRNGIKDVQKRIRDLIKCPSLPLCLGAHTSRKMFYRLEFAPSLWFIGNIHYICIILI